MVMVVVLVSISTYMLRSVFVQLYEDRLRTPGLIFLSQYSYKDILPYIENIKALNNLDEFSESYFDDKLLVYNAEQNQSNEPFSDDYYAAKDRLTEDHNDFTALKDDNYYEIYKNMLNLRVGTGLKYFRIIADVGLPDKYLCIFDATFQGDMGDFDSGDLGMPNLKSNFPQAEKVFSSGEAALVLDTVNNKDQGMYYYYYMPIVDNQSNVVAVIETVINMQLLNERLNSFIVLCIVIIIALSVSSMAVIYLALSRSIITPMRKLTKISGDISEGDIYNEIPDWIRKRTDEMGTLGKSYESMSVVLRNMASANNTLFESAMSGKLEERTDPTPFKGFFSELLSKINDTLDVIGFYFDSIPGSLAILNSEYDIVFANRLFKETFSGFDKKTIYQKLLEEPENDDFTALKQSLEKKLEEASSPGEYSALVWFEFGGEKRCMSFLCSQVTQGGKNNGAVMVVLDSTELVLAKDRALDANRAKSEFLSRVSHELRTPLNVVLSMSKLGLSDEKIDDSNERFKRIVSASSHLSNIINDVLEMSRMESGKIEIRLAPMSLRSVVGECLDLFSLRTEEKGIVLIPSIAEGIPDRLIADEFRIRQILINLLSNAIKFTDHGSVTLDISADDFSSRNFTLFFTVADTGVGMSQEFLPKIFMPFEQEDSFFSRRFEGSGLGLSISHNLAMLMGGDLSVESKLGEGSRFVFTIPVEIAGSEDVNNHDAVSGQSDDISLEGKRILLAEDIEINRMIVREILAGSGVVIDEAADGKEACSKFMDSPEWYYDCILMDIQMPVMNGYEATQNIRRSNRADNAIPIISMTANALKEDVDHAYSIGVDDHIAKPIDFDACIKTIKKYCSDKK